MFKRIPFERVDWVASSFLIATLVASVTAVPAYIFFYGLDLFYVGLFLVFYLFTGLSITLGYHRLFSHKAFEAHWLVEWFTVIFGAAAFENSVLDWASDHRRHHKHVDHDDDPYDISKGFFWAHMGWIMFKLRAEPPRDNVADLEKKALLRWQDKCPHLLGALVGLALPALIGLAYDFSLAGFLGGFLVGGVLRVTAVQHSTFFINSLCHCVGSQPYSSKCSARDSWIMALFTFGEGYHNFHHEFQHDYRNGVKAWQWDPTKWTIWILNKMGMAWKLRTVADEKIFAAQVRERSRLLDSKLEKNGIDLQDTWTQSLADARQRFDEAVKAAADASKQAEASANASLAAARGRIDEMSQYVEDVSTQARDAAGRAVADAWTQAEALSRAMEESRKSAGESLAEARRLAREAVQDARKRAEVAMEAARERMREAARELAALEARMMNEVALA